MDNKQELRIYMKAVSAKFDQASGRHLSEQEMVAFHQGPISPAERETAWSHLAHCNECLQMYKDVRDFLDPAREGETPVSEFEVRREWRELWSRIETEEETAALYGRRKRAFAASRATLAMAAGIALIFGLTAIFAMLWSQERQESRQAQTAIAQLQSRQKELESQTDQLRQSIAEQVRQEQEKRAEIEAKYKELQAQPGQRTQLQSLPQNFQIYSRTLSSDKGAEDEWRLSLPSKAQAFVLMLNISRPFAFDEYSVEFIDQRDRIVKEIVGLKPVSEGTLNFAVSRAGLSSGKYHLRLSAIKDGQKQQRGEYPLTLSFTQ